MRRPNEKLSEPLSLRLPHSTQVALQKLVKIEGKTRSEVVRSLIEKAARTVRRSKPAPDQAGQVS